MESRYRLGTGLMLAACLACALVLTSPVSVYAEDQKGSSFPQWVRVWTGTGRDTMCARTDTLVARHITLDEIGSVLYLCARTKQTVMFDSNDPWIDYQIPDRDHLGWFRWIVLGVDGADPDAGRQTDPEAECFRLLRRFGGGHGCYFSVGPDETEIAADAQTALDAGVEDTRVRGLLHLIHASVTLRAEEKAAIESFAKNPVIRLSVETKPAVEASLKELGEVGADSSLPVPLRIQASFSCCEIRTLFGTTQEAVSAWRRFLEDIPISDDLREYWRAQGLLSRSPKQK